MKKWFLIAIVLLLVGAVMAAASLKKDGLDRFVVSEDEIEKVEYVCRGEVKDIYFDESAQDIEIIPSEDGKCRLEYVQSEYDKYDISFENGVLKVKWDEKFGILRITDFSERVMRLYLPEGEYGKLKVDAASSNVTVEKGFDFAEIDIDLASGGVNCRADAVNMILETASGEIWIDGVLADAAEIHTSSGDVYASDAAVGNIGIDTASGEVTLKDVTVLNNAEIETTSGDVEFSGLDAGYIFIDTASGDVEGSVVKAMQYEIDTASGDIRVPVSMRDAEICRVETASGDVTITEE